MEPKEFKRLSLLQFMGKIPDFIILIVQNVFVAEIVNLTLKGLKVWIRNLFLGPVALSV